MNSLRIREGSSKNTLIFKEPAKYSFGEGIFEFLDYFSVFDWGRFLNDPIKGKGAALAAVARKYFKLLQEAGIKSHYQGMEDSTKMKISLVNIPEVYKEVPLDSKNYLLPIEIIHRIYTHSESSDLKKIKTGKRTYQELGYTEMPESNKKLPKVKIGYSTKLEETDRVLTKDEARILAGLTTGEMEQLEETGIKVSNIITEHCDKVGLMHYDGKIEMAKDLNGDLVVIDVLGTLDEDRFMMKLDGDRYIDISKQFLRNWFIDDGWKKIVDDAKNKAEEEKVINWKSFCSKPPKLPERISRLITEMYVADAELRTREKIGAKLGMKVRSLREVAQEMYEVQEAHRVRKKDF